MQDLLIPPLVLSTKVQSDVMTGNKDGKNANLNLLALLLVIWVTQNLIVQLYHYPL